MNIRDASPPLHVLIWSTCLLKLTHEHSICGVHSESGGVGDVTPAMSRAINQNGMKQQLFILPVCIRCNVRH